MEEINGKIFQVKLLPSQQYAFCIGNTSNYGKYQGGGDVREVIPSKVINFKTFEESLLEPSTEYSPMFEMYDFEKFERGGLLHIALRAFLAFAKEHDSALPKLNHDGDSEEFVRILTDSATKNTSGFQADQFDDTLLDLAKKLALFSRANIPTHTTFWGGVIAQEALKITGKLMPYCQWFHFENYECVPETSVQEREPLNCRYDDFIAVFSRASQNKLSKAKMLLAGAGSMGLEFSKLFALMGVATDKVGRLTVVDPKDLKLVNLTSHLLSSLTALGSKKVELSKKIGNLINPLANIDTFAVSLDKESDDIITDDMWRSFDVVFAAVDSKKSKEYIDSRCVSERKLGFYPGCLGAKYHSESVIPHYTNIYKNEEYGDELGVPISTVMNFPTSIRETVEWAKSHFQTKFEEEPSKAQSYMTNDEKSLDILYQIGSYQREKVMIEIIIKQDRNLTGIIS